MLAGIYGKAPYRFWHHEPHKRLIIWSLFAAPCFTGRGLIGRLVGWLGGWLVQDVGAEREEKQQQQDVGAERERRSSSSMMWGQSERGEAAAAGCGSRERKQPLPSLSPASLQPLSSLPPASLQPLSLLSSFSSRSPAPLQLEACGCSHSFCGGRAHTWRA